MKGIDMRALVIRNVAATLLGLLSAVTGPLAVAATLSITNPTLLFEPGAAVVSVSSSAASVTWRLKNMTGSVILASGTVPVSGGTASFDVNTFGPGYYLLSVSASGATTISTSVGIITDLSTVPGTSTAKFGTTAHPELMPAPDYAGLLAKAGMAYLRFDMRWEQIETSPGVYDFSPTTPAAIDYDVLIPALTSAGIKPLAMLDYYNPNYDGGTRPSTAAGFTAYANYAAAIADRYGASIDYEIYNEYNHPTGPVLGTCGPSLSCYIPMLQGAEAAIHAAAPAANVALTGMAGLSPWWLGGDTLVDPSSNFIAYNWLRDFLDQGGADYVDVFNIHNYTVVPTASGYIFGSPEGHNEAIVQSVKSLLAQYPAASGKPLWLGETGWSTYFPLGVTQPVQASYLVRDAVLSLRQGLDRYYFYDLFDDTSLAHPQGRWGLLHNPTSYPAIAPKPSFVALAVLTRQLDGYSYSSSDNLGDGVYSLEFTKPGSPAKRIVWSTRVLPTAINVASLSAFTVTGHLGPISSVTSSGGAGLVMLTSDPVYVSGSSVSAVSLANLAFGKTVTASSDDGTHIAANTVDADPASYWQSAPSSWPATLTVDLGANHSITQLSLSIPPDWNSRYEKLSVLGSTDGTSFSTIVAAKQYQFRNVDNNIVNISLPASVARYVRISITANTDSSAAGQLSDFQVYGQ